MIFCKVNNILRSTLVLVIFLGYYAVPAYAFDIRLGTNQPGTFSHFTGRILERIINKQIEGVNCKMVPASGDIHNLTNLQQGSLDIALIDSHMLYDAINQTGSFRFLDINYEDLSVILPLYDVPITLVVRHNAGIKNLDDLKGKRINSGAPLSFQNFLVETILIAKTWSKKDFLLKTEISDSQSQDTMAFCHGTIDAMINIGVHPNPSLQQLVRLCDADMANMDDNDIDKLVDRKPAFSKITIQAGTYPGQTTDINTFGTQTILVASQDLDQETVYDILNAIFSNKKKLSNAHPALSLQKIDTKLITDSNIKLHPGAVKYFSH